MYWFCTDPWSKAGDLGEKSDAVDQGINDARIFFLKADL